MSINPQDGSRPTVVLVHGAFADGSSWNNVIERLQAEGVQVTAPANPLRGISIDSAYIASYLDQIPGPVLAVGHSYGGAVITNAATNANNEEAESMNVETSTGAPPGLQARGQDAAMQSETATSADWPTSAEREGLTAPDVLFLALAALLALIGLGSMMLVLAII
jgi:pimeloyl-ACP methyl ester carboxylesterase